MEERPFPLVVVVEMVVPLEANMWDSRRALPRGGETEHDDALEAGGIGAVTVAWLHSDIVLLARVYGPCWRDQQLGGLRARRGEVLRTSNPYTSVHKLLMSCL